MSTDTRIAFYGILVIANVYLANDKPIQGIIWYVFAMIVLIVGILS